jgi:SAM-dependent methyltransferase
MTVTQQKAAFVAGEADEYFCRNVEALTKIHDRALADPTVDPILRALIDIKPASILEIGAANGWRLDVALRLWGTRGVGIEPSREAVADGALRYPGIALHAGTADQMPVESAAFDCVVFGFCLYLCDRSDLFYIAAEANRVLKPGGYLAILDFYPPVPYRNPYAHRQGLFSHKMDHGTLWSWHPDYSIWRHEVLAHEGKSADDPDERLAVTVLKKVDLQSASDGSSAASLSPP